MCRSTAGYLKCRPGRKNKISKGSNNEGENKTSKTQKENHTAAVLGRLCLNSANSGVGPSKDSAYVDHVLCP